MNNHDTLNLVTGTPVGGIIGGLVGHYAGEMAADEVNSVIDSIWTTSKSDSDDEI